MTNYSAPPCVNESCPFFHKNYGDFNCIKHVYPTMKLCKGKYVQTTKQIHRDRRQWCYNTICKNYDKRVNCHCAIEWYYPISAKRAKSTLCHTIHYYGFQRCYCHHF